MRGPAARVRRRSQRAFPAMERSLSERRWLRVFAPRGWVAVIPRTDGPLCPACAADYDDNGGVDGGDLAAFFVDFEFGVLCADVDANGGVDGGDLAYFFLVFEQGGCRRWCK